MDTKALHNLAVKFEKQAQATVAAQPGDVQTALERAKLWQLSTAVAPMLNQAGVSDDASVNISILVNKGPVGPVVAFSTNLAPPNPKVSTKLNSLLAQKFAGPMLNAIKAANLSVVDNLVVKWLNF